MNSYVKRTAFTYCSKQPKIKSVPRANIFSNKSVPKGLKSNVRSQAPLGVRETIESFSGESFEIVKIQISQLAARSSKNLDDKYHEDLQRGPCQVNTGGRFKREQFRRLVCAGSGLD